MFDYLELFATGFGKLLILRIFLNDTLRTESLGTPMEDLD